MLNNLGVSLIPNFRLGTRRNDESMGSGTLALRGEYITLAHAVKAVGLADTGGQAKLLVRSGAVTVNGAPETQPGRKLHEGDRFAAQGSPEWTVTR